MFSGKKASTDYAGFADTVADFLETTLDKNNSFRLLVPKTGLFYSFNKAYYVLNEIWYDFDIGKQEKYKRALIEYMKIITSGKGEESFLSEAFDGNIANIVSHGLFANLEAFKRCAPALLEMERRNPLTAAGMNGGEFAGEIVIILGKVIKAVQVANINDFEICQTINDFNSKIETTPNSIMVAEVGTNGERYYYTTLGCNISADGIKCILTRCNYDKVSIKIEDDGSTFKYLFPAGETKFEKKSNGFYHSLMSTSVRLFLDKIADSFEPLHDRKKIGNYLKGLTSQALKEQELEKQVRASRSKEEIERKQSGISENKLRKAGNDISQL